MKGSDKSGEAGRRWSIILPLLISLGAIPAGAAEKINDVDARSVSQDGNAPPEMTLAAAVGLALRNNRTIKAAQVAREAQQFGVRLQESQFSPQASLETDGSMQSLHQKTYTKDSSSSETSTLLDQLTYDASVTPTITLLSPLGTSYSLQLNNIYTRAKSPGFGGQGPSQYTVDPELIIQQPLLQGFGRDVNTANLEIARMNERLGLLAMRNTIAQVITAVINAYWQAVLNKEQFDIARHALDRSRQILDVNRALVASGRMAELDTLQTQTDIAQNELSQDLAENAYKQSKTSLLALLALPKTIDFTPTGTGVIEPVDIPLETALDLAEQNRIEIIENKISLDLTKVSLLVAEDGLRWDLRLIGTAGSNNTRSSIMNVIQGVPVDSHALSIGFKLVIPLTSLAPEAAVVNAKRDVATAELTLEDTKQSIQIATQDAVRDVNATYRQLKLAEKARSLAEKQLSVERDKLSMGRSSNFQVLTYQDTLRTAQGNEVSARVGYLTALANLDLALGTTLETWHVAAADSSASMTSESALSLKRLATPPGMPGGALPPPMDRPDGK